jgi:hypothetical protein
MTEPLAEKTCAPCRGGIAHPPFETGNQPVNRITVIEPEPGTGRGVII